MGRFEEVTMADLEPGDRIPSDDGGLVEIARAYDIHVPETMYELTNDAGDTIRVSGNHLWYIESSLDIAMHPTRIKEAKSALKSVPDETFDLMRDFVNDPSSSDEEVSFADLSKLLGDSIRMNNVVQRVLSSIGPVSENYYTDYELGEEYDPAVESIMIPQYNKKAAYEQLLVLAARKKEDRGFDIIVGRVVSTERLVEEMEYSEVNIPDSPRNS